MKPGKNSVRSFYNLSLHSSGLGNMATTRKAQKSGKSSTEIVPNEIQTCQNPLFIRVLAGYLTAPAWGTLILKAFYNPRRGRMLFLFLPGAADFERNIA